MRQNLNRSLRIYSVKFNSKYIIDNDIFKKDNDFQNSGLYEIILNECISFFKKSSKLTLYRKMEYLWSNCDIKFEGQYVIVQNKEYQYYYDLIEL